MFGTVDNLLKNADLATMLLIIECSIYMHRSNIKLRQFTYTLSLDKMYEQIPDIHLVNHSNVKGSNRERI